MKITTAVGITAAALVAMGFNNPASTAPEAYTSSIKSDQPGNDSIAARHSGTVVYWQNKQTFVADVKLSDFLGDNRGVQGYFEVKYKGDPVIKTSRAFYWGQGAGTSVTYGDERFSAPENIAWVRPDVCLTINQQATACNAQTNGIIDNPYVQGDAS